MRSIDEILEHIQSKQIDIIENLEYESIAVYLFLQEEFKKGSVTDNYLFQFVYRSFYRLDNAGLSKGFKSEYFRVMEEYRKQTSIDPIDIVKRLYPFKRLKGDNSIQYSFATKLINTINPEYPIYDSEIALVFRFPVHYIKDINKRLERYQQQQACIIDTYKNIIESKCLKTTLKLFDERFKGNDLSVNKKLDFIVWSTGKLIK